MEFEFFDEEDEVVLTPIRPLSHIMEAKPPEVKPLEETSNPEFWKYKAANKFRGNPAIYRSLVFPDSSLDFYTWLEQLHVLNPKVNLRYSFTFYKAWNLDNVICFSLQIMAVPFFRGFDVEASSKEELIQKIEHAAKNHNVTSYELPNGTETNNAYAASVLSESAKSTLF